ncbi:MAG: response regulator, partial [Chloroflexi bacterium]|nr:response regulator [Chloroflexota bacterium]
MKPGGIDLLLVEDNPGDSRLVREMLRGVSDITLDGVDRLAAAERHLASGEVDIVLLDLGLPDSQGLDTLARVRAHHPALPVIVFTGLDDEDIALEAVKAGAQDYLVKGRLDEYSLTRAIRYAVERRRAETSLLRLREEQLVAAESVRLERGLLPSPLLAGSGVHPVT